MAKKQKQKKTLKQLRAELDQLGVEYSRHKTNELRDQISLLAFQTYDASVERSMELNPLMDFPKTDFAQQAFWYKCKGNNQELSDSVKTELIHEAMLDVLFNKLDSFQAERGRLTMFLEKHIYFRVVDQLRQDFGRTKKDSDDGSDDRTPNRRIPVSLNAPQWNRKGTDQYTLWDVVSDEESGYREVEKSDVNVEGAYELMASVLQFSEDRDRIGVREQKRRRAFRVLYTGGMINLEHDGDEEPAFRYRSRIERVLEGAFSDYCLEQLNCRRLLEIRRSPIREEHYVPLKGKPDSKRMVGGVKDAAAAGFLGMAKSSFSETRKKYKDFLWSELRKKKVFDEDLGRM